MTICCRPSHGGLQQHQRQPRGDRQERRRRIRAAEGLAGVQYTKDRWARAFELQKFPEIRDIKPSDMMRQMKALLPTDSRPGTYFMAWFLLRQPSDMRDHLITKDFRIAPRWRSMQTSCTAAGGATQKPLPTRTTRRPSTPSLAAAARSSRPTAGGTTRRAAWGAAAGKPPARTRRTATSATFTQHTATRRDSASPDTSGSRETE
jgi:hypothetical protein